MVELYINIYFNFTMGFNLVWHPNNVKPCDNCLIFKYLTQFICKTYWHMKLL